MFVHHRTHFGRGCIRAAVVPEHPALAIRSQKIAQLFRKEGWDYFDGSDPATFGMDDRVMKDKDHAQETFHVALLAVMAEDERLRQALHLDPSYLKALLDDPRTTPWYPPYPERSAARLVRHVNNRRP